MLKKIAALLVAFGATLTPLSAADALTTASEPNERAQLIGEFLASVGCTNSACSALAYEIADEGEASTADATTPTASALPVGTIAIPLSNPSVVGNGLLQHLSTLFVLDSLFQSADGGLVTPGPATLANIIVLYELFYGPNL